MVDRYAEDDRSSVRVRVKWQSLNDSGDAKSAHAVFAVELPATRSRGSRLPALPRVEITKIVDADGKERSAAAAAMFAAPADPQDALLLAAFCGEIQFGALVHLKAIPWQGPARQLKELHGRVRLTLVSRPLFMEVPAVVKALGEEVRGPDGIILKVLEADAGDDEQNPPAGPGWQSGEPDAQTDDQKVVRVRPGVLAGARRDRCRHRAAEIARTPGAGCIRRCPTSSIKRWRREPLRGVGALLPHKRRGTSTISGLVLTKAAKTVTLDMPFQVRDVPAAWRGNNQGFGAPYPYRLGIDIDQNGWPPPKFGKACMPGKPGPHGAAERPLLGTAHCICGLTKTGANWIRCGPPHGPLPMPQELIW